MASLLATGLVHALDSDGDGLSDADEVEYYLTDPDRADTDGDGMDDGLEVATSTDPNDRNSVFRLEGIELTDSGAETTVQLEFQSEPGKAYTVFSRPDLAAGSWEVVGADIPGTGDNVLVEHVVPAAEPRRFYKVGTITGTSGLLTREFWEGIDEKNLNALWEDTRYPDNPTWTEEVEQIDFNDEGGDYGERFTGYLTPPVDGNYTFWIASRDHSAVYLSTDDTPANAQQIIDFDGSSARHSYEEKGKQKTKEAITLAGGQRYYLDVQHKFNGHNTNDHVTLAWSGPGFDRRPVSAAHFTHFQPVAPVAAAESYSLFEDSMLTVAAAGVLFNDSDADGDALTAVLVADVSNGSLSLAPNGGFSYTPDAHYHGSDSFIYRANDGSSDSNAVTVILTVLPLVDDLPHVLDDSYAMTVRSTPPLALEVLGPGLLENDVDPEGGNLSASLAVGPTNGSVTVHPNGSFSYTPNAGFSGTDVFTYEAHGKAGSTTGTVQVVVGIGSNSAPVAVADSYDLGIDEHFETDAATGLLANDSDPDGDTLRAVLLTGPASGQLDFRADGSFAYQPDLGSTEAVSFTYEAYDGLLASGTTTVTLNVAARPTGYLSLQFFDNVSKEAVSNLTSDPRFPDFPDWAAYYGALEAHTPDRAFPFGPSSSGMRFSGYIHPPTPGDYTFYATGLRNYEFWLSTNDDPANAALLIFGGGANEETATVNLTPGQRYYFEALLKRRDSSDTWFWVKWSGPGLAKQIISADHLSHVPLVPTAAPDSYTLHVDQTLNELGTGKEGGLAKQDGVMRNDSIPMWDYDEIYWREDEQWQNPPASVALASDVSNGTLVLYQNGTFTYTPNPGFTGTDSFTYQIESDGDFLNHYQGVITYPSATATVTLNVLPLPATDDALLTNLYAYWPMDGNANDASGNGHDGTLNGSITFAAGQVGQAAVFSGLSDWIDLPGDRSGKAYGLSMWIRRNQNTTGTHSVLFASSEGELRLESSDTDPRMGSINFVDLKHRSIDAITPLGEWAHLAITSKFRETDGGFHVYLDGVYRGRISELGRIPLASLGNASNSPVMDVDEVVVWSRSLNEAEIRKLYGRGRDGIVYSVPGTAGNFNVPVGVPDEYSVESAVLLNGSSVLANDHDPEGSALTAVIDAAPSHAASFTLNADGTFTYTSDSGFSGLDTFTYRASDGDAGGIPTTVRINVANAAAPPYGLRHEVWNFASGDLLDDPDYPDSPDVSTFQTGGFAVPDAEVYPTRHGNRLSGYIIPPVSTYYKFSKDSRGDSEFWLSTDENPENLEQILTGNNSLSDEIRLKKGQRYYCEFLMLLTTDIQAQFGEVRWRMYGKGPVTSETVIAEEYLVPANGNAAPIPVDHVYGLFAGETFSIGAPGVLAGVTNVDDDALAVSVVSDVSDGSLTLNPDGSFDYTPDPGFSGNDSFTFKVDDGFSDVATATVTLEVVNGTHPSAEMTAWSYGGFSAPDFVVAAPVAGWYACASRADGMVEVKDFRQDLLYRIQREQIEELVGSGMEIASVCFSTSGRLLFIGLVGAGEDAILRYNVNTKKLNVFTKLDLADNLSTGNLGLIHYDGELYVGTDDGLRIYDATLDLSVVKDLKHSFSIPSGSTWVNDLTVDMYNEQIYLTTPDALYRLDGYREPYVTTTAGGAGGAIAYRPLVPKPLVQLATPTSGGAYAGVSVVRTFGDSEDYFLFVQERIDASTSHLRWADGDQMRLKDSSMTLSAFTAVSGDLKDICGTPCGRLMLALPIPQLLADSRDTRFDITGWAAFHTQQQINNLKANISPDYPGIYRVGKGRPEWWDGSASHNNYAATIAQRMILADYLFNDPDAEEICEEAMTTLAGTHPTYSFETSNDGLFPEKGNEPDGAERAGYGMNVYWRQMPSILSIYYAFRDRNPNIKEAGEILLEQSYRMRDYMCAPQGASKRANGEGGLGPDWDNMFQYQGENPAAYSMTSALDPLARKLYYEYYHSPSVFRQHSYLSDLDMFAGDDVPGHAIASDERIMFLLKGSHLSNFARFGDAIFKDEGWRKEFYNIVFGNCGVCDDARTPYLYSWYKATTNGNALGTSPSLGEVRDVGKSKPSYDNSGGSRTPFEVTEFHQMTAYCALGDTWPALTLYLAYREGRYVRRFATPGWKGQDWPSVSFTTYNRFDEDFQQIEWTDQREWFALADVVQKGSIRDSHSIPDYIYDEPVANTNAGGNTELKFWMPMHHHVLGSDDGSNWVSYGFQRAPFEFTDGASYAHYRADIPEGQDMRAILDNEYFEAGDLSSWTQDGTNFSFSTGTSAHTGLVGTWAKIGTTGATTAGSEGSLRQTLDLSDDLDDSSYIVRGNGFLPNAAATGRGFLRIAWDNDNDPSNGTQTPIDSNVIDSSTTIAGFRVDTVKPAGFPYLHMSFVVEGQSESQAYRFDNLCLVRSNGPLVESFFEQSDLSQWTATDPSSMFAVTSDPAEVIDGSHALKVTTTPDQVGQSGELKWTLDISGDPNGTRYVARLHSDALTLTSTDLHITASFTISEPGEPDIERIFAASNAPDNVCVRIEPHFDRDYGELVFTLRKAWNNSLANVNAMNIYVRASRMPLPSDQTDTIILDQFEIRREAMFPIHKSVRP